MSKVKNFFSNIGNQISNFFRKLGKTKPMQVIKDIFMFIPNLITNHTTYRTRKSLWGIVFIVPLAIGFIYFFMIPFVMTIIYSFSNVSITEGLQVKWIGIANYKYIFTEDPDWNEGIVSAVLSLVTDIPVILIFSLIMAVVLNSKFKGRAIVRAIFFMPVIFNSQAIDVAMSATETLTRTVNATSEDLFAKMFNFSSFLLNANFPSWLVTFLGSTTTKIYDIIGYSGVQILIFLSAIQAVPKHLYEAAKMEGATQYEMFWKITFPMVSPMMLTAAVYTVVDSFMRSPILENIKVYDKAGDITTDNLGILTKWGINAAMSWTFCLVSVLVVAIVLGILSKVVFYYDE